MTEKFYWYEADFRLRQDSLLYHNELGTNFIEQPCFEHPDVFLIWLLSPGANNHDYVAFVVEAMHFQIRGGFTPFTYASTNPSRFMAEKMAN